MIVIVETVGSASANSYVSLAEALAYLATRLNASLFTGGSVDIESQKAALCEATRELSIQQWRGYRSDTVQALAWPRTLVENPDSIYNIFYDINVIPQRVKDATCELALEFLRAGTKDVASLPSNAEIVQKSIDVLHTTYANPSQRAKGLGRFPRVQLLIAPLLMVGPGQVKLVR